MGGEPWWWVTYKVGTNIVMINEIRVTDSQLENFQQDCEHYTRLFNSVQEFASYKEQNKPDGLTAMVARRSSSWIPQAAGPGLGLLEQARSTTRSLLS